MNISKLFELSPAVEVAVRNIYWRNPALTAAVKRAQQFVRRPSTSAPEASTRIERILPALERWGLRAGDLVVLHSGYRALRADGASPDRIIDAILEILGPKGTLAAPAIPVFPNMPKEHARITADVSAIVCDYDPLTTPAWTGAIPSALMRRKGAVRSLHPLNSLVALGPLAADLMSGNLDGDKPRPCGPTSSWAACYRHGVKVLALGADMAHSLTMIHLAEDLKGEAWPVKHWCRDRRFRILVDGAWQSHTVQERHPRWAMYYGERTLSRDLHRSGLCLSTAIDGVNVEALRGDEMVDYLDSRNHTLYPYFHIPMSDRKSF